MLIGEDYEKIHIQLFGLDISEPNVFITDTIMAGVSLILAALVYRKITRTPVSHYWFLFFLIYGISSFFGGVGHAMFSYWGIAGKFFTWTTGIFTIYLIEMAMIKNVKEEAKYRLYSLLSMSKMLLVFVIFTLICVTQPISEKPALAFLPVAINTIVGVSLAVGLLGYKFTRSLDPNYRFFYYGVLIMVPSSIVFLAKINLHPWFEKNDLSHVLLTIGLIYYYIGIKKTQKHKLNA
jgi:hypothetical protein